MERQTFFVDVILPLSLPNYFTYRVPFELNARIAEGKRVIVPFGRSKYYSAIIRKIHEIPPEKYTAKYIESILDESPIVNNVQFRLWEWLASYYMCHTGEVLNAALPSGLKLSSETKICLDTRFEGRESELSDNEFLVIEALRKENVLGMAEIASITGMKSPYALMRSMLQKGAILSSEEIREKFKPRIEVLVKLSDEYITNEALEGLFVVLEKKAPKQADMLTDLIRLGGQKKEVRKSELLHEKEGSVFNSLVKKNIFSIREKEVGRFNDITEAGLLKELSPIQQYALEAIHRSFSENEVTLVHGVTSSGKTEIYTHLIKETLEKGKQVLYLIPEIAITAQLVDRLRSAFGNAVGVYHSRFNENERVEVWNEVLGFTQPAAGGSFRKFSLITGARSAMFLPFSNLGLIIIDEEHDHSFKQQDPAPRYHARDAAIYLAKLHEAKVVLGTATPSLESGYNADRGKYGRVILSERHGGIMLPEIHLVDMKKEWKEKKVKGHFSEALIKGIELTLVQNEQVILFQNRRGFAPVLECEWCAWTPCCVNCDVSLVYHKSSNQLRCHYCGHSIQGPTICGACGDNRLKLKGFGTEQIDEEIGLLFPGINSARLDLDTTRSRYAHHRIIQDFSEGKIRILTGTQMVSKGLDFENVTLVGVLDADGLLRFPDFRSHERAFDLMEQVAGRAGRRMKRGNVIIQTKDPLHPVLQHLLKHDYAGMYTDELGQRSKLHFPPFVRLIEILLSHSDLDILEGCAMHLGDALKVSFSDRVLGPEFPLIQRVRNKFRKKILIKFEKEYSLSSAREAIASTIKTISADTVLRKVSIQINVDPL